MEDNARAEADLQLVERLIADACGRATALERAIGVMRASNADAQAADKALMATYHALGLLYGRRAILLKVVAAQRHGPWAT